MRDFLCFQQQIAKPLDNVFAHFADPHNLPGLMPDWQQVRLESVATVAPTEDNSPLLRCAAGAGSQISLSMRIAPLLPLRVTWVAEIVEFEANHYFCDRQLHGPFAFWQHCHRFTTLDSGSDTLVTDEVQYQLPLGPFGRPARAFVRRQIEAAFAFRRISIAKVFAD